VNISIGNQDSLEWIQLVVSSFITLIAVFLGAWIAFRFEVNRDARKDNRRHVSAINRTIFSFGAATNKLLMIKMQAIDPIRNHPLYFLEMRPLLDEELESVTSIVFDDMNFNLETEHRNLLMELFVEQENKYHICDSETAVETPLLRNATKAFSGRYSSCQHDRSCDDRGAFRKPAI